MTTKTRDRAILICSTLIFWLFAAACLFCFAIRLVGAEIAKTNVVRLAHPVRITTTSNYVEVAWISYLPIKTNEPPPVFDKCDIPIRFFSSSGPNDYRDHGYVTFKHRRQ